MVESTNDKLYFSTVSHGICVTIEDSYSIEPTNENDYHLIYPVIVSMSNLSKKT